MPLKVFFCFFSQSFVNQQMLREIFKAEYTMQASFCIKTLLLFSSAACLIVNAIDYIRRLNVVIVFIPQCSCTLL